MLPTSAARVAGSGRHAPIGGGQAPVPARRLRPTSASRPGRGMARTPLAKTPLLIQARSTSSDGDTKAQSTPQDLSQSAADIARRLRRVATRTTPGALGGKETSSSRPPPAGPADAALTALLTSLLATLTQEGALGAKPAAAATRNDLLSLLTAWADEYLVASDATGGRSPVAPALQQGPLLAKHLFMQLLSELLPPPQTGSSGSGSSSRPTAAADSALSRGLLAATAAAFAAQAAADRLAGRGAAPSPPATPAARDIPVSFEGSAGDVFDADAWEEAARVAAWAAMTESTSDASVSPAAAAAAVAQDTAAFDPSAWEAAAAAAAAAAATGAETDNSRGAAAASGSKLHLPAPCWVVSSLAAALQVHAARAAAMSRGGSSSSLPAKAAGRAAAAAAAAAAARASAVSVARLLLLPAQDAAEQLLLLPATSRAAVLLLLCGADGSDGLGTRGEAWLLHVLAGVRAQLGLMEMGVALAAIHTGFGSALFFEAAAILLPLTDPGDPQMTTTGTQAGAAASPRPAAALQALLLHWLLLPQLAAAGLPVLPQHVLQELLHEVVRSCTLQDARLAARWGGLWPLTKLDGHMHCSTTSGSGSGDWQLTEPSFEAALQAQAWCGLTGVPLPWLAHVAAAAAAVLLAPSGSASEGATAGRRSGSSGSSAQMSSGAAAAANDARAVLHALLTGLAPAEPLLLLVMQQVLAQQQEQGGFPGLGTAQLLQLLLEAYCGSGLPTASLADIIHRSFVSLGAALVAGNSSCSAVGAHHVSAAAAQLLAALPAAQLQEQLAALLGLASDASAPAAASLPALQQLVAALAHAADPSQMAVLLRTLPMPLWADAWAAAVSPVSGSFCWNRAQLAAALAGLASHSSSSSSSSSSRCGCVKAAWAVVAAHFALRDVNADVAQQAQQQPLPCFDGSLGAFAAEVLSAPAPVAAAATHIAALAEVLPADGFARVAAALLSDLGAAPDATAGAPQAVTGPQRGTSPAPQAVAGAQAATAASVTGLRSLSRGLMKLHGQLPELAEVPLALQLCAAAAPHLALDLVPGLVVAAARMVRCWQGRPWLPGASSSSGSSSSSSSSSRLEVEPELLPPQQLELLVAAAAAGRDGVGVQHLASMLARQLPVAQAQLALGVVRARHPQLSAAAIAHAADIIGERRRGLGGSADSLDDEAVWQLGQSSTNGSTASCSAELGRFVAAWVPSSSSSSSSRGTSHEGDRQLVARLAEIIADIPAAAPEGSWPMDAMQSPTYTAPLLKRCLALMIDWVPSCPSAAAAASAQLSVLACKRRWSHAEAGAILQRLPLKTALQLLLEAGPDSGSGGGSSRKSSSLLRLRPKLMAALAEWQGAEAVVQALRELLAHEYSGQGLHLFVQVLCDLTPALSGATASSTAVDVTTAVGLWPLHNAFAAALLLVLGPQLPQHVTTNPMMAEQLAAVLCLVARRVPEATSCQLAEQLGRSYAQSGQASGCKLGPSSTADKEAWQLGLAALLAALPAAWQAASDDAAGLGSLSGAGSRGWSALAAAVCAGAAEAAGSQGVLGAIRATFLQSPLTQAPAQQARAAWAAQLEPLLARLQHQGLLTCGLALGTDTSIPAARSHSRAAGLPVCISMQLLQLLQELHTHKALHLQQAAAAVVALAPSLGPALPLAVTTVLGGGWAGARGYGTAGPDAATAQAALEAATAPALPAAMAAAAQQLAQALAVCHELLADDVMTELLAALAAVLPWDEHTSSTSCCAPSRCPAEAEMAAGGWCGVTQTLLITSSLLTGSCRVWGQDKGTHVAASLVRRLVAASPAATAALAAAGTPAHALRRSRSDGSLLSSQRMRAARALRRAASTGGGKGLHAARARTALTAAAGSEGKGTATNGSSSSTSQAAIAAAALARAAASGAAGRYAELAQAKLLQAASTGGATRAARHAPRAQAALEHAAASGSDSGSHAQRAEAVLLQATSSGAAAAAAAAAGVASSAVAASAASNEGLSAAEHVARTAWATERLLAATDAWFWPGLSTAQRLVRGIIYPKQDDVVPTHPHAASSSNGSRFLLAAARGEAAMPAHDAAAALVAAVPRLATEVPVDLIVQVLALAWPLLPVRVWGAGLQGTMEAVAAGAGSNTHQAQAHLTHTELLLKLVRELQLTAAGSTGAACACAQLLLSIASFNSSSSSSSSSSPSNSTTATTTTEGGMSALASTLVAEVLQEVASILQPDAAAEMLLELSRPSNSSGDDSSGLQMQLLGVVAPRLLSHFSAVDDDGISAARVLAATLGGRAYQAALLPRTYLSLLLRPHLDSAAFDTCIRQLGLATGHTTAAAAAMGQLCTSSDSPGRRLPVAVYAEALAVALRQALDDSGCASISIPEARMACAADQRRTTQQLLTAVVAVLGSFRGMRRLHTSFLGAQMVLPLHDLAAVLCYSWELMPPAAAHQLAGAVAAALAASGGPAQLEAVLALLPAAAAEGFGKGRELWQPLLHHMALAGGMSGSDEARLASTLLGVSAAAAAQASTTGVRSHPVTLPGDAGLRSHPVAVAAADGAAAGGVKFADPAAVTAALEPAAANNAAARGWPLPRHTASAASSAPAGAAAQAASGAGAGDSCDAAGSDRHRDGESDEESEAALALVSTASLAGSLAATSVGLPLVGIGLALVAIAAAAQRTDNTTSKGAMVKDDSSSSSSSSTAGDASPLPPSTPAAQDRPAARFAAAAPSPPGTPTAAQQSVMGGRTKAAAAGSSGDGSAAAGIRDPAVAAALACAAAATAAAAAAAAGACAQQQQQQQLGSMSVDPEEAMQRIRSNAAVLPLDEALTQVVPLLLLPDASSSHTWPLLALGAIVAAKFPRVHALLGPGHASLLTMALAATLLRPDGPLATVMRAAPLVHATGNDSDGSRRAALMAAEAVSPHAVGMQLAGRLLDSLWRVLLGNYSGGAATSTSGSSSQDASPTHTDEAAADEAAGVWQQTATHLLAGMDAGLAAKLLCGFAQQQAGSWEAQLRVLAVAAALQDAAGAAAPASLMATVLAQVCAVSAHPPLSFLVLLLQHQAVRLSSADTSAVLDAALQQLVGSYGTRPAAMTTHIDTTTRSGSGAGYGGVGAAGEFDTWQLDALWGGMDVMGGLDSFSSSGGGSSSSLDGGPRYRSITGRFVDDHSTGSSSDSAPRSLLAALPESVMKLVDSLVAGARGRQHAAAALAFVMQLLALAHGQQGQPLLQAAAAAPGAADSEGKQLVLRDGQVAQLLALANGCCEEALAAPAHADAAATLAQAAPELARALAARGCSQQCNKLVAGVCAALAAKHAAGAGSSATSWVTPELAGRVLAAAAEGVRRAEGVVSAAKPGGGSLVAAAARALFARALSVQQCLVLLSALAPAVPEKLALQLVAAGAGRLHSVMPQAVSIVRQAARSA